MDDTRRLPLAAALVGVHVDEGPGQVGLAHIDLDVPAGSLTVLQGGLTSGAATLMWVLAGALRPRRGRVEVAGVEPHVMIANPGAHRRRIGLVTPTPVFPPSLLVGEVLELTAVWAGGGRRQHRRQQVLNLCRSLGISDLHERPQDLSTDGRHRLAMARALVFDPDILLVWAPESWPRSRTRSMPHEGGSHIDDALGVTLTDLVRLDGRTIVTTVDTPTAVADQTIRLDTHPDVELREADPSCRSDGVS